MPRGEPVAAVTSKGAITLGRNVVADGPAKRLVRVVTHAHSDHLIGLPYNVRESAFIAATPTTFKFLEILGYRVPASKRLELPYGKCIDVDLDRMKLVPARHIAGSAQVYVEGPDYRVGYTGDFKLPGTDAMTGLDVLVIDATYGSPELERRWRDWDALSALIAIIERYVSSQPIWIYGYNGKMEEIIFELRRRGLRYDFYVEPKTLAMARVAAEFYGMPLDGVWPLSQHPGWGVALIHYSKYKYYKRRPGVHVILTGWEMGAEARQVSDRVFRVSYSDHATFSEVMSYVEEARPRMVIVDAYRGKKAAFTAKYIQRRLGITAVAMP